MDDEITFMLGFIYYYSNIKKYADTKDIEHSDIQVYGGKIGKTLSEYFAISGQKTIPVSLLNDVIVITDQFLDTGEFDKERSQKILEELDTKIFPNIAEMFKAEHKKAQGNDDEMPLVLFVFGYAQMTLEGLEEISKIADYPTRHNRINLLRESLGKSPKQFSQNKNTP